MTYSQFVKHAAASDFTMEQLRCEVRPTEGLLDFIDAVGGDYEYFVRRYEAQLRAEDEAEKISEIGGAP